MSATTDARSEAPQGASGYPSILGLLLRYGALIVIDAMALLLIYLLAADGIWELAIAIGLITLFVNVVNVRPELYPIRWMSPAISLMALMVIYPIVYTVFVAFTNYGDGHLLTKQQSIDRIEQERYLPEDGQTFDFTFYRNDADEYALLLEGEEGGVFFAAPGTFETLDIEPGATPDEIQGYALVPNNERFQALSATETVEFGTEDNPIAVTRRNAQTLRQRYIYDEEADAFTDQQTGDIYAADDERGIWLNQAAYDAALAEDPQASPDDFDLITGFRALVGFSNFERFLTSPAISGPLLDIFVWTVTFALLSVLTTFVVGLLIALLLQADTPAKKFFRTMLIVPYAIPALISVATWKGMLNPNFGVLNGFFETFLGYAPPFFQDATWGKIGILMINLWLGYPYFMLVCSGALAAIPSDMYEAARVDGANWWQQFRSLTLPMLLVAVGPLLIASFTYNFNNFVIIDVYNEGGPPIPNTPTPAGYTDILISYAFRLAFGTGRGANYGLASAITIIIFIMVAAVTLLQFRFTRGWEETSENV